MREKVKEWIKEDFKSTRKDSGRKQFRNAKWQSLSRYPMQLVKLDLKRLKEL